LALGLALSSSIAPHFVEAQSALEQRVNELEQENRESREAVARLMESATSFRNAIDRLQAQINQLESQIRANEKKRDSLQKEIDDLQVELERQKSVLGENIKAMYVGGEMTTLEMLATSKDLSDFVDKEAYRNALQKQIQDTLEQIAIVQNELQAKKEKIGRLLYRLGKEQNVVDEARAEQARLLSMNQAQQNAYNDKLKTNQEKIDDLNRRIEAQRALNSGTIVPDGGYYFIRFPGPTNAFNPGNYPYKNAGFSMQLGPCSHYDSWPDYPDRWGYCTRQCVSYTAWAVEASGRSAPMYYGSAKNWINKANRSWIHRTPKSGDVAITTGGTWGHAMYVEEVRGNSIFVSQYNQQLTGKFSYQWRTWR
jgi:peptidoglycan hydrolase CwlO-like protein